MQVLKALLLSNPSVSIATISVQAAIISLPGLCKNCPPVWLLPYYSLLKILSCLLIAFRINPNVFLWFIRLKIIQPLPISPNLFPKIVPLFNASRKTGFLSVT
jgi:hypothetical protein